MGKGTLEPGRIAAEGFVPDAVLVKPVDAGKARDLFDACVRARLPSRVLVVDHSETVRAVVRKVLQSCRYRFAVEEAGDGASALAAAGRQRFDVVLLDAYMPGGDSSATLEALLRLHHESRVVVLTATNDVRTAESARAAGAHDVLYKPFFGRDIDAVMNRLSGIAKPGRRV
jgi:CheY-like chemotaxis protein